MDTLFSCDWGTTQFRLRLISREDGRVIREHATADGVAALAAKSISEPGRALAFERVLEQGLAALGGDKYPSAAVVISGMASSNLGWKPLPYATIPAPLDGTTLHFADFRYRGRLVRMISGLRDIENIMRGEECELAGLFSERPWSILAASAVVVLPGTHSKHVRIEAGKIVGFTTHLTGELYGLLSKQGTLAVSVIEAFDREVFLEGVRASRKHGLGAALFQTRARTVLGILQAKHSAAFLSGVLIGDEVVSLGLGKPREVILVATEMLAERYAVAFRELLPATPFHVVPAKEAATAVVKGHILIANK